MVELIGQWTRADGTPESGVVTVTPVKSATHLGTAGARVITDRSAFAVLDTHGRVSMPGVLLSDDPGWQTTTPVPYLVTAALSSSRIVSRVLLLEAMGDPIDLTRLTPYDGAAPGPIPVPGLSAYELAVLRGYQGDLDQWLADLEGPIGPASTVPGPTGPTGPVGATGPAGPAIGGLLTVKGDTVARDGSGAVRVPVGQSGQVLTVDPAAAAGVAWKALNRGEWETAATWAALPASGNWPGRRVKVLDGLGLCVAVWDGAWKIDPVSDTGRLNLSSQIENGWTTTNRHLRRSGSQVQMFVANLKGGTTNTISVIPLGWRPDTGSPTGWFPVSAVNAVTLAYVSGALAQGNGELKAIAPAPTQGLVLHSVYTTADPWPTAAP